MTDTTLHAHKDAGYLLLYLSITVCLCANSWAQEAADSLPWHEKSAVLRFRIEKDNTHSLVPNVSLLDIPPDKKSANVKKWIEKNRWTQKPRVRGELCLNFLPSFGSKPIVYDLARQITHFVARAAIVDGADPNTAVTFEVYADKRLIFRCGPLTPQNPLAEINAGIPVRSRQLRLVTISRGDKHLGSARWVDPGFLLRGVYPKVSVVHLYAPGYELENFTPEVVAPSSGAEVRSEVLYAGRGEPMDILFETLEGNPSYLVYLVPKDGRETSNSSWEPRAGLVLETKWTRKNPRSAHTLAELEKVFDGLAESVGRSLVESICQAFPIHRMPEYDGRARPGRGGVGLYRYTGFFGINKKDKYEFATISRNDSYLFVDDKLVASWPGRHDIYGGRRGEKHGTISLDSGVHKLEYFHFSPWPNMFAVAAWKKPGEELRLMTRTDFVPVGRYEAASFEFRDANKAYAPFEWSVADDFRLDQTGRSFVAMRFDALRQNPLVKNVYRWTFDDGTVAEGESVEHVFLRPGLRHVQLEIRRADEPPAQTSAEVYVHPAWDKCLTNVSNVEPFDQAIRRRNLDKVPPDDLVNLFEMGERAGRADWKGLATTALATNIDRLVEQSRDVDFIFKFGQYLQSPQLKQYDKALELFSQLAQKTAVGRRFQQEAAIAQAEVLLNYFGRNDEALKILNQLKINSASRDDLTRRALTAKAEAMLALGQAKQAIDLVRPLAESSNPAEKIKQQIKHAGLIRHARVLAQSTNDPNQLDYAMTDIETVFAEDPMAIFSPGVNLVKLDVHLVRGEFRAALYLTERLKNLQLSDFDLAEVLARQVVVLCGLKNTEKAKAVYVQLSKDYPSSPATDRAKQALLHALEQ
jgi:NPCBM/NEW2 domain/PKD domain